ncbi:hypothetical protein [Chenggangzhangella methanolivorans]|uniref:Uncharacterized protein n=1 Tax=Chenggangzhangella methanolivorans TaxID=1437009 RepID=A0A9E6RB43_9HYPH|nr:hypothetical protein [Chenggangzhangella methanolivorans]QZO01523.1 hypothetical protein K6K41_08900 [Chenggangzhangella methanolivorans]
MTCRIVAVAVGLLCLVSQSHAAPDEAAVVEIRGSEAAADKAGQAKPFIKALKPCGSAADLYICANVTASGDATTLLPAKSVKYPGKGVATVTWQGSVFCDMRGVLSSSPLAETFIDYEYYAHLALTTGATTFSVNEPGSASVGERFHLSLFANEPPPGMVLNRTSSTPVTLVKTYEIKKATEVAHRVVAIRDWRKFDDDANNFCNINGGAMSVTFVPY